MYHARLILRFAIAPLSVALAFALKWAIQPVVEPGPGAFAFFAGAVTVSAWLGGLLPGLIALGLATVTAVVAFLPPGGVFLIAGVGDVHRVMAFILEGLIICLVCHLFHRARERAESATAEAKEALKARRTSEARFRRLAESDVIGIIEGRGETIVEANDAFLRMVGYSRDRLAEPGLTVTEITPEPYQQRDVQLFEELFRVGTLPPFEKEYLTADGCLVPILAGGALIEPGGIDWVAFVLDLSRQKEVERELARAISRAEAASRAKSEFLAVLSHELITPMNAILGMNQLAMAGQRDPVLKDYLATAQESAEALLALLSDLLDYSSIEVGDLELEPAPFRLRAMLNRAIAPLEERASRKGLTLDCRVETSVPDLLFGDSRRLRQVLVNLLDNAIKFTRRGGVTLAVGLEPDRPSPGGDDSVHLRIEVEDTGIGIAIEDRERIFSPFTQIDGSSTRPYSGTGLGLSICRQIVGLIGGKIDLRSEPDRGTRFVVSIPIRAASPVEILAIGPPTDLSLAGLPALVAIEGKQEREAVEAILLGWSMRPRTVADGRTALRLLAEAARKVEPFPVVLLDDRLPGLDPIEVAARIRRDRLAGSVILIASEEPGNVADLERAGGSLAVFQRPVEPDRLIESISLALRSESRPPSDRLDLLATDRPMRILLAEDTPANQKLVLAVLGKRGHQVDLAANGQEAVDLALQERYDLILMDLQMPLMDGLQATSVIRSLDAQGNGSPTDVPIVAITAHASSQDRRRCFRAGMNDYLSKPIDISRFLDVVESYSRPADGPGADQRRAGGGPGVGTILSGGDGDGDGERNSDRNGASAEFDDEPAGADDTEEVAVSRDRHDGAKPIYDRPGALRRLGGDEELFRDMIGFYLEDYPTLLDQLCKGLLSDDHRAVERAAHSLKGLAANSGAGPAVKAAGVVEDIGRSGRLADAPEAVEHLVTELQRLRDALASELDAAPGRSDS